MMAFVSGCDIFQWKSKAIVVERDTRKVCAWVSAQIGSKSMGQPIPTKANVNKTGRTARRCSVALAPSACGVSKVEEDGPSGAGVFEEPKPAVTNESGRQHDRTNSSQMQSGTRTRSMGCRWDKGA